MNKSIAGFKIFHGSRDYQRMLQLIRFYSYQTLLPKFSQFLNMEAVQRIGFESFLSELVTEQEKRIDVVSYCLMPTHIHLVVRQLRKSGISKMMSDVLNAYARYFNTKRKRHGPLWVGRFKNVPIRTDEQLLHVTRYVHLNPVTAKLVAKPEQWKYSSYLEFLDYKKVSHPLCSYEGIVDVSPEEYKKFTNSNIHLQQELSIIKRLALE